MALEFLRQPRVKCESDSQDKFGIRTLQYVVRADNRSAKQDDKLAGANVKFFATPIRLVLVEDLIVVEEARGYLLSSMLMRTIEQRIVDEGAIGVLRDTVGKDKDTPPEAKRMYERHDWVSVSDKAPLLAFNVSGDPVQMRDVEELYEDIERIYAHKQSRKGLS